MSAKKVFITIGIVFSILPACTYSGRLITLPLEYIMGETGGMYLAGDDGYMRQRSRFVEEPTILQKEADTEATRDA